MKRKVIAVTGGIGSGKSQVCAFLRQMGYATVDCDELARQVADEKQVIAAVEGLLGSECITNGAIDRKKVREKVFADENLLKQYDKIFHGRVRQCLTELVNGADNHIFVEIAVIDAFDFPFDEIWLVESDVQTRIARVTARDKVSAENVEHIINRQRYQTAYTRTLVNDGSLEQLQQRVFLALKKAQIV